MKKFIYLFEIGGKIVHSGETTESLLNRINDPAERELVQEFVDNGGVGSYLPLNNGDFIFCTR